MALGNYTLNTGRGLGFCAFMAWMTGSSASAAVSFLDRASIHGCLYTPAFLPSLQVQRSEAVSL
jgi:hypothetical protein